MLGASLGVFNLVVFVGGSLGTALVGGLSGVLGVSPSLAVLALLPLVAIAMLSPVGVPSAPDLLAGSGDDEQVH
jgi:hypothetical protein